MSVHNCGLRSSFLEKIPPEPPHASAQRREAVQVSHRSHLCRCSSRPRPHFHFASCRCKFASCAQTFLNAGKLKRHVRYAHGDKNKYFKVCLNTPPCPRDGTKMPRCKKKPASPGSRCSWLLNHQFSLLTTWMFCLRSVTNQTAHWPSKNAECLNCT